MNKNEIKQKVSDLVSSGVTKSLVFAQLSGQGVKDNQLAHFIASYADPRLCEKHDRKVNIIITLTVYSSCYRFSIGLWHRRKGWAKRNMDCWRPDCPYS